MRRKFESMESFNEVIVYIHTDCYCFENFQKKIGDLFKMHVLFKTGKSYLALAKWRETEPWFDHSHPGNGRVKSQTQEQLSHSDVCDQSSNQAAILGIFIIGKYRLD